ncbi:PEP-CTERM sorting domain-containing protein [Massilia sp. IC2-477]|uniref:PEP-CTERM sorting domain-containing protein n=1 Tax=Massilia sp. IC2-477 TaxID=2887198 RepID=UPI001D0FF57D|nr:PEP-CTERM sorting domain-containing protein [Massilia sp. IC2-477]MCC2954476.1 PEP-CTERM sorting domain-containing protein [Massilia sp. IC2-477]
MFANLLRTTLLCTAFFLSGASVAAPIEFVPPNDATGTDYAAANDSWWMGRGITFGVDTRQSLTSIGFRHDLSNMDVTYGLYEISTNGITLNKLNTLASGGSTVSTNGRDWIDYALGGVVLETGRLYLLEFAFAGEANSNFYYNNENVQWNQGAFIGLDGAMGPEVQNFVVAAFRLDATDAAAVPEPGSIALFVIGAAALVRRRSRR